MPLYTYYACILVPLPIKTGYEQFSGCIKGQSLGKLTSSENNFTSNVLPSPALFSFSVQKGQLNETPAENMSPSGLMRKTGWSWSLTMAYLNHLMPVY